MRGLNAPGRQPRGDWLVGTLLVVATIVYLWAMPRNLGHSDEAYYLYHAKRLLQGQVLYRDIFDFKTPLFTDMMAVLFRFFGTDMATARIASAVLHGAVVLVVFRTCRAAGVRHGLAAAAALAHLAVAQPTWPYASPHWASVLLVALLMRVSIDRHRARGLSVMVLTGLLLGTLVATQQQIGAVMAVAPCVLLAADHFLDRRYGAWPGASVVVRLLVLVGAALAIVVPVMQVHIAQAGVEPVLRGLIRHPFMNYRVANGSQWAATNLLMFPLLPYTVVPLLRCLPLLIPMGILSLWAVRHDRARVEVWVVLLTFSVFSMLSIAYFPDIAHVAFIAPVFFVLAAVILELLLSMAGRFGYPLGIATAAALFAASVLHLRDNFLRAHAQFPFSRVTAFGRVDFASKDEVAIVDAVRAELDAAPSRELFCYPVYASLYLTADADNPTAHDLIFPVFQDAADIEEVVHILERRQVQRVVLVVPFTGPQDPVRLYVQAHYACRSVSEGVALCARRRD